MRTITIIYDKNERGFETMHLENGEFFVDVEFNTVDDRAYFVSFLEGDDEPVFGSSTIADAEAEALYCMGIPNHER